MPPQKSVFFLSVPLVFGVLGLCLIYMAVKSGSHLSLFTEPSNGEGQIVQKVPDGWKTYSSDEYGYSLAFPASWDFYYLENKDSREDDWLDASVRLYGPEQGAWHILKDGLVISILLARNSETLHLNQWLVQYDQEFDINVKSSEKIVKQGILGVHRVEHCFGCSGQAEIYYFPLDVDEELILMFTVHQANPSAPEGDEYQELADAIYQLFQLPSAGR